MAENMADSENFPTELHSNIYRKWGVRGWGMILTGNVQVDNKYLGESRDVSRTPSKDSEFVKKWTVVAEGCKQNGSLVMMQINHPGRRSPLGAGTRNFCQKNIAPSAVPLDLGSCLVARLASSSKIIIQIIHGIRSALPATFCVGIKLNSVDHQSSDALQDCVKQLKLIVEAGVDFIEISGGTYEDPQMMQAAAQPSTEKSARTLAREAFFLEFASAIRHEIPDIPLLVTGGFRTRIALITAIRDNACDMVGLG